MTNARLIKGDEILGNVVENCQNGIGPTLWRTVDKRFDAFEIGPNLVAVIGAPPKAGKTALSMQIVADTLIKNPDLNAYICNCELSPPAIMQRLLARYSGISATTIRFGISSKEDKAKLENGLWRLEKFSSRLVFYQGPFALDLIRKTFGAICADPGILLLDYLQRLRLNSKDSGDDRRVELEGVMSELRDLADVGLGVIGISAVARQKGNGGSNYASIGLASLRGSSELEYGADSVWLLHSGNDVPKPGEDNPVLEGYAVFECAANRNGDTANIPLVFAKREMTFHPLGELGG